MDGHQPLVDDVVVVEVMEVHDSSRAVFTHREDLSVELFLLVVLQVDIATVRIDLHVDFTGPDEGVIR